MPAPQAGAKPGIVTSTSGLKRTIGSTSRFQTRATFASTSRRSVSTVISRAVAGRSALRSAYKWKVKRGSARRLCSQARVCRLGIPEMYR